MSDPISLGEIPFFQSSIGADDGVSAAHLPGRVRGGFRFGKVGQPVVERELDAGVKGAQLVVLSEGDAEFAVPRHVVRQMPRPAGLAVDWRLVGKLRQVVANELADWLNHAREASLDHQAGQDGQVGRCPSACRRCQARDLIGAAIKNHEVEMIAVGESLSPAQRESLAQAVFDSIFGLGRLQPLISDPDVENIMVYGFDDVHVERADFGHQRMDPIAESDEELTQMIQDMASHAGGSAPFSPANPNLEMMLPDGSRLAATLSTGRPSLNIRRHRIKEVTVDELIGLGSVTQVMADFLKAAVRANLSICISGPMNSGKTTFLRALCTQFTSEDVVGTFESDREIMLHQEPLRSRFAKVYPWEERSGGGEIGKDGRRAGRREMSELIIESKRFNLTRAVIGEVRGKEVWQVIKTMEEIGCLFTTHAISAGACMEKLISCAQEDPNVNGVELVTRKLGQTLHLVIQLEHERQWIDKGHDQWRWDRHVKEIVAAERGERSGSGIALTTVFRHVPSEPAVAFQVPDRLVERLRDAGWTQTQEQQFLLQIQANLDRWAQ